MKNRFAAALSVLQKEAPECKGMMLTAFQRLFVFVGLMALYVFVMGVIFPVAYLWNVIVPLKVPRS